MSDPVAKFKSDEWAKTSADHRLGSAATSSDRERTRAFEAMSSKSTGSYSDAAPLKATALSAPSRRASKSVLSLSQFNYLPSAVLILGLAGCSMSPMDFPQPAVMTDGGRGYSMTGYVRYTSSLPEAQDWVQKKMDEACGGPAKLVQYRPEATTNAFGVPFVKYDVIAECPAP